jgi:uncharacterized protein (DUF1015 family)
VAAVPYDVVDTQEARALAEGNPLSFLHVSRAEIDLPDGTDPHADLVYRTAAERYRRLKSEAPLVQDDEPALYVYELEAGGHSQAGVAGCCSLAEYDADVIRKHERTRRDKEDDRTRHMVELRAQTGPVFLTHRPSDAIEKVLGNVRSLAPLVRFEAVDGVRHSVWRVSSGDAPALVEGFAALDALYIADGHHRAASASRAREAFRESEEARYFLAVAFSSSQVRILPYNRVVRDLNGLTARQFLQEVGRRFPLAPGSPRPRKKGEAAMFVNGAWRYVSLERAVSTGRSVLDRLDYNVLQEQLLKPILGVHDVRTDARIDFVGGARGTEALESRVTRGEAAVAFSMHPVSVAELMSVSDAGGIMPPKSTWFEPKLRDGLLIHEI